MRINAREVLKTAASKESKVTNLLLPVAALLPLLVLLQDSYSNHLEDYRVRGGRKWNRGGQDGQNPFEGPSHS